MLERMMGAARLNVHTFEEVENDTNATTQAMLVVVIVSVASGIGTITIGNFSILPFLSGIVIGIVGWAIWAFLTFFIGTKILNTPETHADWGQLARGTAFAQTPNILRVFGIINPFILGLFVLVGFIWVTIAMIIAVRQCLDYTSTWRALGVVLIAVIPYLILMGIIISLTNRVVGVAGP